MSTNAPSIGSLLRHWRSRRGFTQTAFAEVCGISQRHASCIESGRAYPSRELVLRAGAVLDVPLGERNELLRLAGFAPMYGRRSLDDAEMGAVRLAIDRLLSLHEPFPAVAVDAGWSVLQANRAAQHLLARLIDLPTLLTERGRGPVPNVMHLSFHPQGLSRRVLNWPSVAAESFARLQQEAWAHPDLAALITEIEPWLPAQAQPLPERGATLSPVLQTRLQLTDTAQVDLFTTLTTFGTAQDVLTAGIRVEHFFPADAHSEAVWRAWYAEG